MTALHGRILGAVIALVLLAGVVAAATRGERAVPADGARVELDGTATVTHGGGEPQSLHDGDTVGPDDEVEVASGTILLRLAGGGTLEGRVTADGIGTRIVLGSEPELAQGDLLVAGRNGLSITAAGTVVSIQGDDGVARVRRGLSVLAGVYSGGAAVDSSGQQRTIERFRQLGIASLGRPAAQAEPYQYDAADPWDQRFLGGAIELTNQLNGYSNTFTANIRRNEGHTAAGYELILPELKSVPDFDDADVAAPRNPGDILVGAVIALLGHDGTFQSRLTDLFDFRDEGAEWGLVALDQGVDSAPVLGDVQQAVAAYAADLAGQVAAGPTPTTSDRGTGTTTPTTSGTSATTRPAPTTPTTRPTSPTTPPPTTPVTPVPPTLPPATVPPADTGIPIIDDAVDTVNDLLGGLLGGGQP